MGYLNRFSWWLATTMSHALEPAERDAVLGDIAESGQSGPAALRDVLSLAARRHAGLWREWRLPAIGLIFPAGVLLGLTARYIAGNSAIYIWLYASNWDWDLFQDPVFRHDLAHYSVSIALSYLTLACWSWTGGFAIGTLSRRNFIVNGALFGLTLWSTAFVIMPWLIWQVTRGRDPGPNGAVFGLLFYRVVLPVIVTGTLVMVPALCGMRCALRVNTPRSTRPFKAILWMLSAASMAVFILTLAIAVRFPNRFTRPAIWSSRAIEMLQFVAYWPVVYLTASMFLRRWHAWRSADAIPDSP